MRITVQSEQINMQEFSKQLQEQRKKDIEFFKYQKEQKEEIEQRKRRQRLRSK